MAVAVAERPVLLGAQVPRINVVPEGDEHPRWDEVVDFVRATGTELDPWQLESLRISLLRRGNIWAAFSFALCAPRQNGKNGTLEMRELVGAIVLEEKLQIHTAHLADTSKEAFRRLDEIIDSNSWLSAKVKHIWRTNGHESIEFHGGCRIRFRTRTKGGGRGFAGSPVYFDEAMFLPTVSMGSILPVISAQPDPQVWYMGSAVDQAIMDDGMVFSRVRDRAMRGAVDRLAYREWSLDAENPNAVTDDQLELDDLAVANPAFGLRISPEYVEAERMELDRRTFIVERGGVGDWPAVDGTADEVIPLVLWDALAEPDAETVDARAFSFDVTPDRSMSAIAMAGRGPDGVAQVELVEHRPGTKWVSARLFELAGKKIPVKCDASGPAGSLIQECEDLGLTVEPVSVPDQAKACGMLFDLVTEARIRHLGDPEIRSALKGAAKRLLGDAWAWSRKSSAVDISPLVASTLALWGSATTPKKGGLMPAVMA